MILHEIKELAQTILNRHFSGRALSEDEFNLFVKNANIKLFEMYLAQLKEASSVDNPLANLIERSTELRPFKKVEVGSVSGGFTQLPTDYKEYSSVLVTVGNLIQRQADVVSEHEMTNLRTSVIVPNLSENPKVSFIEHQMKFLPTNTDSFELWYLKNPISPFYDYCITNGSLQVVYMPVDSQIVSSQGLWDLVDVDNNVLAQDVTHALYPGQVHESDTVELEWNETVHSRIVYLVLVEMGLKLDEQLVVQYSMSEINKK